MWRCPPAAAAEQVLLLQGHPFARAHLRTRRYPLAAARVHVTMDHGQPCCRAHWRTASLPSPAAISHTNRRRRRPQAKQKANWAAVVFEVMARETVGRCPHASLQDVDTEAKNMNSVSGTNSERCLTMSLFVRTAMGAASPPRCDR